jgi:ABC-type multidrug transport system fused ATPase/permease subunit
MNEEVSVKNDGEDQLTECTGLLEVKDIKFSYPSKPDVEVLKGVTFSTNMETKRVVAICGTSGCGKSSIISLIERFYDPTDGQILFNGKDIRELDMEWYHQCVGIVQQEPVLFNGTVADNILYGLDVDDKTDSEVLAMLDEAAKLASCFDFIYDDKLFPDGYDTVVGERGVKLSGGQKQRIAIARALIRKP